MAIQNRRGTYADFDPSRMVPGEIAVIQSGDPGSEDGRAVYFCVSPGHVKRFATINELRSYNSEAQAAKEAAEAAAQTASAAYLNADQAMQSAQVAATTAQELTESLGPLTASSIEDITEAAQSAKTDVDNHISSAVLGLEAQIGAASTLIDRKRDDILGITTTAEEVARNAMTKASEVDDAMYEFTESFTHQLELTQMDIDTKVDRLEVIDNALFAYSGDTLVAGPIEGIGGTGGGGGGGAGNSATISLSNASGWNAKTITPGSDCFVTLMFSSIDGDTQEPTGNGTLKITGNGATLATMNVAQGEIRINVTPYVRSGDNQLRFQVQDVYGNTRTVILNVKLLAVSITSTFDSNRTFNADINYTYTPNGSLDKTVHFLLDGVEIGTQLVRTSGRQQTYFIPRQAHGSHTLEVYFTAEADGMEVESNHLFYDLICTVLGNYDPIIAIDFADRTASQYSSLIIPYTVYNQDSLESEITLLANGAIVNTLTVDRTRQAWTYRASEAGPLTLTIVCGSVSKSIILNITPTEIDAAAETQDLSLYLSSYGRSNAEANPDTWTYGDISAVFTGFNHRSDGWQKDADGITVLRVAGDARLEIPFQIFAQDCRTTGKTIEIEFATRDVRDYDAPIISCMQSGRGIELTAQLARLASEQSEISMQYKDEEHLRVSFVVEKRAENRLLFVYVDGVLSGTVQYPADDDFQQTSPVGISIGSSDCAVDIYCIRVYDNNLTRHQLLDNWIADTQDGPLMLERYAHNNVYDEYGQVVIEKLPRDLPYLILEGDELPTYKGDKKTIAGRYVNPIDPSKSFIFDGAQIDVQGTSSQYYARKNYKIKFKNGFIQTNGIASTYALTEGAVPTNVFTFKADVASSEGANNVELARLYNDTCPYKTPPQRENEAIRSAIDGFPIVVFWANSDGTSFLGKYNFNNDKGSENVFGFSEGDESWEIKNNTSDRVLFKSDDFESTDGEGTPLWLDDFEGRYPDGNEDSTNLSQFVSWVKSTEGNGQKFKDELSDWVVVDSAIFYWIFTELFLMVDSRAKNAFPTMFAEEGKWCFFFYDGDTAIGINNEGQLVFGYSLEDTDHLDGDDIFNGQESVFWVNLREQFGSEIAAMYNTLRSTGALSYEKVRRMFDAHQSKWPEAIFNEDAQFKYLDPLTSEGNASYLAMLQGSKKSQRDWWLYHRFRYMDSRFGAGDNQTDVATVRGYAKSNITLTPYADLYASIKFGSSLVSQRAWRNEPVELVCPLSNVNDTEIYIYSASRLASVGDLSGLKVGYADFTNAVKLQTLKLGDGDENYENARMTELHLGNNTLLKLVDCRNCVNLGTGSMATLDLSGCSNIETVLLENTKVTGVYLPNGGLLKTLHLPRTTANLTLRNQTSLEDLQIQDGGSITTLWLENASESVDADALIAALPANSRLRYTGFHYEVDTIAEIDAYMDIWDLHRGLDENGNTTDTAQISGTFHIDAARGDELARLRARYPYVTVLANHTSCTLTYYNYDGSQVLHTETVIDGGNGTWTGTPSRSQTAQYTYTFAGWSKTPSGVVWSAAQQAVDTDRSIYATYTATVRKYTVYFYNGSTLLYTQENVPYGTTPTYGGPATSTLTDPNNPGQPFQSWSPTLGPISGSTSYYAQFQPPLTDTITDDWTTIIANIANAATGAECGYALGDTKILDFGSDYGPVAMQLVAFDTDNLTESGKAKTTWLSQQLGKTGKRMNPAVQNAYDFHSDASWNSLSGSYTTSKSVTSKSLYSNELDTITAHATYTITSATDQDVVIGWKTSQGSTYGLLSVSIDGTAVLESGAPTTEATTTLSMIANTPVVIEATYNRATTSPTSSSTATLRFAPQGGGSVAYSSSIDQCLVQYTVGYVTGTGTSGGWPATEMYTYVNGLKDNLPAAVQAAIKSVTKTQPAYQSTSTISFTQTSQEELWIPSYQEMFSNSPSDGVRYTGFFTNAESRKKFKAGAASASWWWLRSASYGHSFHNVYSDGSTSSNGAYGSGGVAVGFCI